MTIIGQWIFLIKLCNDWLISTANWKPNWQTWMTKISIDWNEKHRLVEYWIPLKFNCITQHRTMKFPISTLCLPSYVNWSKFSTNIGLSNQHRQLRLVAFIESSSMYKFKKKETKFALIQTMWRFQFTAIWFGFRLFILFLFSLNVIKMVITL